IILGDPPQPGKAMRIDAVDHQRRHAAGQPRGVAVRKPADLDARAAEAFDTMRRRVDDEYELGIRRPEPGGIGRQGLAPGPAAGMGKGLDPAVRRSDRVEELAARRRKGVGKIPARVHGIPLAVRGQPNILAAMTRKTLLALALGAGLLAAMPLRAAQD